MPSKLRARASAPPRPGERLNKCYKPTEGARVPVEMKITHKEDKRVYLRPCRLSPKEQGEVNRQDQEWLDRGIIRPINSRYASNVVVARKKHGTPRVCVNLRKINEIVEKGHFLTPFIEEMVDDLGNAEVHLHLFERWIPSRAGGGG